MHINVNSIKVERFRLAESQIETIKSLLEFKEGQEAFVRSP